MTYDGTSGSHAAAFGPAGLVPADTGSANGNSHPQSTVDELYEADQRARIAILAAHYAQAVDPSARIWHNHRLTYTPATQLPPPTSPLPLRDLSHVKLVQFQFLVGRTPCAQSRLTGPAEDVAEYKDLQRLGFRPSIRGLVTYAYENYATLHEARRWARENGHPHRPTKWRSNFPDGPFKLCADNEIAEVLQNIHTGTGAYGYVFPGLNTDVRAPSRLSSSFRLLHRHYPMEFTCDSIVLHSPPLEAAPLHSWIKWCTTQHEEVVHTTAGMLAPPRMWSGKQLVFDAIQAQLQHSLQIAERTTSGRPYYRHQRGQGRTWRPRTAQAQLFPPPGIALDSLSPRQAPFLQWQPMTSGNHEVDCDTLDRYVCQAAVCIQRAVRGRLLSRSNAGSRSASAPQIPVADPVGEPRPDLMAPLKVPTVDSASLAPGESDDAASAASTAPAGDMALLPWIGLLLFSQWTRPGRRSRFPRCSGSWYQPQTVPPYHTENPALYDNTANPGLWPRPRLTPRQCCNYSRGKPKPNCSINHGCTDGTGPRPSFEPV